MASKRRRYIKVLGELGDVQIKKEVLTLPDPPVTSEVAEFLAFCEGLRQGRLL